MAQTTGGPAEAKLIAATGWVGQTTGGQIAATGWVGKTTGGQMAATRWVGQTTRRGAFRGGPPVKGGPGVLPHARQAKLIQPNAQKHQEMTPKSRENKGKHQENRARPKIFKRSQMRDFPSNQINSLLWLCCGFRALS